ncbi:hypothetical protein GCM10017744_008800 [Streptomyces antimycoticus]|uniref:Uncharacterized protein n=1 Tax=Streptomyces antimycoticus TaxID=68175 RepID=A0A4D4KIG1_9ACTN|nr:hypothetical protein SANT12839_091340 [Streptomyces antimycoticus]
MAIRGVDVVGPFPAGADHDTEFSAVPSTGYGGPAPCWNWCASSRPSRRVRPVGAYGPRAATGNGTRASWAMSRVCSVPRENERAQLDGEWGDRVALQ